MSHRIPTPSILAAVVSGAVACAPEAPPRLEHISVPAPSLAHSVISNSPRQPALVLLPPGYHENNRRYPVVYYLPGFATDVTEYVDGTFGGFHLYRALDASVREGGRELVVVVANGRNALGGSFYVSSPVTGGWEDHVVRDVVTHVERRYRVRSEPGCRGVAGDSMGGQGALRLAMRHPDVFGAVFAASPGLFDERGLEDQGMLGEAYAAGYRIQTERMRAGSRDEAPARLVALSRELFAASSRFAYRSGFALAYAAAFAPAPDAGPPFVSWNPERLRSGFGDLERKVSEHRDALGSLRGLHLDIGRNDPLAWVPRGTRRFSRLLTEAGIDHRLTEHGGGHVDRLGERVQQEMLPFFSRVLCGEGSEPAEAR